MKRQNQTEGTNPDHPTKDHNHVALEKKKRFSHRFLVKPSRVTARGEELTFNWIYWHING